MDKSLFFKFEKSYQKKYSHLSNYGHCRYIFELNLRLAELKEDKFANINIRNFIKKQFFLSNLIKKIFVFILMILNFFLKEKYIFIRSKTLSYTSYKILKKKFEENNINVLGTAFFKNNLRAKFKYILSSAWFFDIFERTLEVAQVFKSFNIKNIDQLKKNLRSRLFLEKIKLAYRNDLNYASKIIKNLKLKGLLLHTDQTPSGFIFIMAAKSLNLKTSVLAHGNFRSPFLSAVLPLHADRIFTWTEASKDFINKCLRKNKAFYIEGIKSNIIERVSDDKIIFASSPFKIIKTNNYEKIFFRMLRDLNRLNLKQLIFCPHPEEDDLNLFRFLKKMKIKISKDLYDVTKYAYLVLGSHSSFLFESYSSGIPTAQISDICSNPKEHQKISGVPQIYFDDLFKNGDLKLEIAAKEKNIKNFNVSKIINYYLD